MNTDHNKRSSHFSICAFSFVTAVLLHALCYSQAPLDERLRYLEAGFQANMSKIKALHFLEQITADAYSQRPKRVSLTKEGKVLFEGEATRFHTEWDYEYFIKGEKVRYDAIVKASWDTLVNGSEYDRTENANSWRRSYDGSCVRAVHVYHPDNYIVEKERLYAHNVDIRSNLLNVSSLALSLNDGRKITVADDALDGRTLPKITHESKDGILMYTWVDPQCGFLPVKRDTWADDGKGQKRLYQTITYAARQFSGVWMLTSYIEKNWALSETDPQQMFLVEDFKISVKPESVEVNLAMGNNMFEFNKMGINPRGFINDTRKNVMYAASPEMPLNTAKTDTVTTVTHLGGDVLIPIDKGNLSRLR